MSDYIASSLLLTDIFVAKHTLFLRKIWFILCNCTPRNPYCLNCDFEMFHSSNVEVNFMYNNPIYDGHGFDNSSFR